MCRIHAPPFGGTLIVVRYQGCFEASLANQQNHKSIRWLLQIVEWGKSPMPRDEYDQSGFMAPVQAAMAATLSAFVRRP